MTDKKRYIKISLAGGSSYYQPEELLYQAIDAELIDIEQNSKITLTFELVEMTDKEYKQLPEFIGH